VAAPELTPVAERILDEVAPLAYADPENGHALAKYVGALALPLDKLDALARDEEDRPGWAIVLDPDAAPAEWLRWLSQFVGVRLLAGLSEADQRARIKSTSGFHRGTPAAIRAAAEPHLTGDRRVYIVERHGSPYRLTVATMDTETPDPAAVERAIRAEKPAGLKLAYSVIPGGTFDTLRDTHSDFADVRSTFLDFDELRADPAKQ
jgi:hypothetical protein